MAKVLLERGAVVDAQTTVRLAPLRRASALTLRSAPPPLAEAAEPLPFVPLCTPGSTRTRLCSSPRGTAATASSLCSSLTAPTRRRLTRQAARHRAARHPQPQPTRLPKFPPVAPPHPPARHRGAHLGQVQRRDGQEGGRPGRRVGGDARDDGESASFCLLPLHLPLQMEKARPRWRLHGGYMVVTWRLHGGYMTMEKVRRSASCRYSCRYTCRYKWRRFALAADGGEGGGAARRWGRRRGGGGFAGARGMRQASGVAAPHPAL